METQTLYSRLTNVEIDFKNIEKNMATKKEHFVLE